MKNVTVRFGSETFQHALEDAATIGDVLMNRELKAVCGWGDNVKALVAGVEQPSTALAPDGGTIVIETRANDKQVVGSVRFSVWNWFLKLVS